MMQSTPGEVEWPGMPNSSDGEPDGEPGGDDIELEPASEEPAEVRVGEGEPDE